MGSEPRQGLYVNGKLRSQNCRFLIDTGSTDTIVNASIYHMIDSKQRPKLEQEAIQIQQVDGSPLPILGAAWVEIQIGQTTQLVKVIFADIKCSGILGMDFLLPTGGSLDFRRLSLKMNGEEIKCTSQAGEPFVGRLVVSSTTSVPAGHEAIIPGRIANKNETMTGPALIEASEGGSELETKGLILARALVEADTDVLPLRVFNPSDQELTVKEGTVVGVVTHVTVDHDVHSTNPDHLQDIPKHLSDLFERSKENLHHRHHNEVKQCLIDFQDVFSTDSQDIGKTDIVKHSIHTRDAKPIKERPRRQPLCNQEEINRQVKELEERGVIEPSNSPWAANVVLVRKKDGTKRLCIDYRQLNEVTIKDAYPIPRIDETIDALGKAKWFSTLDLSSGYWQVALDEDAQEKSTFVVRNGLYKWKVMPFG